MTPDDLSAFSEEDWEDLESTHVLDTPRYELDPDLKLVQVPRNDSDSPCTVPPRLTYAQALGQQSGEGRK
jgi:hypothetical protein